MEESARPALGNGFRLILLLGLLLRLGWAVSRPASDAAIDALPDQREYLSLGRNLLHGELGFFDPRFQKTVVAYRTPGYPLFVAACAADVRSIQIAQAFIDASTILAIFLIARFWLNERHANVAAGFVAINPFLIFFCPLILSETLFTAMLAWGIVLLLIPRKPKTRLLASGLLLAAAVMVRPSALFLPVLLGVISVIVRPPAPGEKLPSPVATMLVLIFILLAPWAARNRTAVGRWIWTTTNAGITEYDGFNPDADGSSNQSFINSMPWLADMSETQRSDYLAAKAANFIRDNPIRATELAVIHIARTWSPIPLSREYASARNIALGILFTIPMYFLILLGLYAGQIPTAAKWLLIASALYLTVVHALSIGSLRYRLPAEPPMAVLAAAGVSVLSRRRAVSAPDEQSPDALS